MQYKIWRYPYSRFGGLNSLKPDNTQDETLTAVDVYTDEVLADIAANGFNAIWLHAVFADVTQVPEFPEFGQNAMAHVKALNTLAARSAKHGIKIFLYFQPVRAIATGNKEFWKNHAECAGQIEMSGEQIIKEHLGEPLEVASLCTSVPAVKNWIRDAATFLAANVPDLGGVILITASEYPGHCYSHRKKKDPSEWTPLIECPRCREREGWEVALEEILLVHEGLRKVSDRQEVIAWNWGWSMWLPTPCKELLEKLPKDVILMADCERGGVQDMAERPSFPIDEYSLSYAGPSPRCSGTLGLGRKLGLRGMLKLQLGTTHELGSVLDLPLMTNIFRKADFLKKNPDMGYMGCWNFGNSTSANTAGFNFFLRKETPENEEEALKAFASFYFPACDPEGVLQAWLLMEQGSRYMPFFIPFLYRGCHAHGLSYSSIFHPGPLNSRTAGNSYRPCENRGDDLSSSTNSPGSFSLDELISNLGKMAVIWKIAAQTMLKAVGEKDEKKEAGNMFICASCMQSAEHAYRAYRLRLNWEEKKSSELLHVVNGEIENVKNALFWVEKDPRQGWHGEAFVRMFTPESMREKLRILEEIQSKLSAASQA
ncbi:MAG: hypothetical protein J6331_05750 [Lentisphaeria bacterium]|nr:hypothetical protein [Lentisphaeria bacterium]